MIFRFADPWLLLLLIIPLIVAIWAPRRGGADFGPWAVALRALRPSRGPLLWRLLVAAGLAALVLAAARPQFGRTVTEREHSGRDVMLVIDLSTSMLADDMFDAEGERIDRLEAVMEAAARFVDGRPSDRIGLVFFADQALTSCPLTLDHETVRDFLKQIEEQQRRAWSRGNARSMPVGLLGSGTNTGLGMARALAFLEGNAPAGKAIVIITDGRDTRELPNWVDPFVAAEQAARLDVRVHAIGVGDSNGSMSDLRVLFTTGQRVLRPLQSQFLPDLGRLQGIADRSGGVALRANNRDELIEVFRQIDELEPSIAKVRAHEDFSDRFLWPLALGAALLALAFVAEPRLRGVPQ